MIRLLSLTLKLKESWKRRRDEKRREGRGCDDGGGWVALKNKLVRAQRRVRCKLPGQPGASERQAQMSTEGTATLRHGRRESPSAHVHQLVRRGVVCKRLEEALKAVGLSCVLPWEGQWMVFSNFCKVTSVIFDSLQLSGL